MQKNFPSVKTLRDVFGHDAPVFRYNPAPMRRTTVTYVTRVGGPSPLPTVVSVPSGTIVHGFVGGGGVLRWFVMTPQRLGLDAFALHDAIHYGVAVPERYTEPLP